MTSSFGHRVTRTVRCDITIQCLDSAGRPHDLDTVFSYDVADPYAVTITFRTREGDLPWTFARELLAHGQSTPTGTGDVHVSPSTNRQGQPVVSIELSPPDGHLATEAPGPAVHAFLEETFSLVPAGEEHHHMALDSLLVQLLDS